MIRLLALDLDGTLMDDDMVIHSDRVRRAIAAAQERDVVVTLATGRMLDYTLPFADDLGITAPLICYQGGLIQAPDDAASQLHAGRGESQRERRVEGVLGKASCPLGHGSAGDHHAEARAPQSVDTLG